MGEVEEAVPSRRVGRPRTVHAHERNQPAIHRYLLPASNRADEENIEGAAGGGIEEDLDKERNDKDSEEEEDREEEEDSEEEKDSAEEEDSAEDVHKGSDEYDADNSDGEVRRSKSQKRRILSSDSDDSDDNFVVELDNGGPGVQTVEDSDAAGCEFTRDINHNNGRILLKLRKK